MKNAFKERLFNKSVTVMGLGTFGGGIGAAKFAAENGANVTVTDLKTEQELSQSVSKLEGLGISFVLGRHDMSDFTGADIVVASPAVPIESKYLAAAAESGAELTTEISLFVEFCPSLICGITGSNGKTTTVSMIRSILEHSGRNFRIGGNIGGSLLSDLPEMTSDDIVVLELSSFQLEWLDKIKWSPNIAAVLNLTPNHIDRHGSLEKYSEAKRVIIKYQKTADTAVLVFDDPGAKSFEDSVSGKCVRIGAHLESDGITLENEWIAERSGMSFKRIFNTNDLLIPGKHNILNAMTAVACVKIMEIDNSIISKGLGAFNGITHRLEFICENNGVKFYNDSKATTPEAASAAVKAFGSNVIPIFGGYDKGVEFDAMAGEIADTIQWAAVIGVTAEKISGALSKEGIASANYSSLAEALAGCIARAHTGDIILLSPGCASYDMFSDYEKRGEIFKSLVREHCGNSE
ncbi:UDP-N-acetylmuramoyl-L-alanine--D-glutamate ligase [Candidatus Latescibacterota bacterium]